MRVVVLGRPTWLIGYRGLKFAGYISLNIRRLYNSDNFCACSDVRVAVGYLASHVQPHLALLTEIVDLASGENFNQLFRMYCGYLTP